MAETVRNELEAIVVLSLLQGCNLEEIKNSAVCCDAAGVNRYVAGVCV